MKKVILLSLVSLIIFVSFTNIVSAINVSQEDITFCDEGVTPSNSSEDYIYLNVIGNENDFNITTGSMTLNQNVSGWITATVTASDQYAYNRSLGELTSGIYMMSFDIKINPSTLGGFFAGDKDPAQGYDNAWQVYAYSNEWNWYDSSAHNVMTYSTDVWYNFTFIMNASESKMDWYWYNTTNNSQQKLAGNMSPRDDAGAMNSIDELRFFGNEGGWHVDNIRFFSGTSCPIAGMPTFEAPTPSDGQANDSQVNINVSCTSGNISLWFDANNPPTTLRINQTTSPDNYTTNATTSDTYYYIASCDFGELNSSVRSWFYDTDFPSITLNPANFFTADNTSAISEADAPTATIDITFSDLADLASFTLNITNGSGVSIASIVSSLNGTSYNYTSTVDVNQTRGGTYTVNISVYDIFGHLNQTHYIYEMGKGIFNCTLSGYPAINFSMRNESTYDYINKTLSMDFAFHHFTTLPDGTKSYGNYSQTTLYNNQSFCVVPNSSSYLSNITVDFVYDGTHFTYQRYLINISNATQVVNLYITDGTTEVEFNVKDTFGNDIEDAYITIEKYTIATNTYRITEILETDTSGNAIGRIKLSTEWYRFTIAYRGINYLVDGPLKMISTTRDFRINLIGGDWYDDYDKFREVSYNFTFTNATKVFNFRWADAGSGITSACLKVMEMDIAGNTALNTTCVTGSYSGTILIDIGNDTSVDDKTYMGIAYVVINDEEFILNTIEVSFDTTWSIYYEDTTKQQFGVFMTFLLSITLLLIGIWHPAPSIIMLLIGLGLARIMGIYYLGWPAYITLIILGGIVIMRIERAK